MHSGRRRRRGDAVALIGVDRHVHDVREGRKRSFDKVNPSNDHAMHTCMHAIKS